MKIHDPVAGSELVLSHAKHQMAAGITLTHAERLGAMAAAATELRQHYGPTVKTAEPVDIPLPETIKGAIASAKG